MREHRLVRREFLAFSTATLVAGPLLGRVCGAQTAPVQPKIEGDQAWYDVSQWGVEGKGWTDTERFYDRLPAKAKGMVRDAVWSLSRHSAGLCARFATDARAIFVRYRLLSATLAMPHMPATGVSGVDLYAADQGRWCWLGVARPGAPKVQATLAEGIAPGRRDYLLYLPLYNGVESLEIGVNKHAAFEPLAPRSDKPLVFYGTSITQGGCASRPGMAYPALVGRRLDRPTINLGFSGNGRMEQPLADLMAELEAAVYIIDCLPNMDAAAVAERTEPLVRTLRQARPKTPILLVEDRTYTNASLLPSCQERHAASRAALKGAYRRLVEAGVAGLAYLEGEHLLGDDGEAATDGSHPSDLGMARMAEALEKSIRPLLAGSGCGGDQAFSRNRHPAKSNQGLT